MVIYLYAYSIDSIVQYVLELRVFSNKVSYASRFFFSSFKVGGDLGIVRLIVLRALLQEVRCYLATGNDGS